MKKLILLIILCPLLSFGQFINYSTADGLVGDNIQCFKEDFANNLWIGTTIGLSFYDGVNFTNFNTANGLIGNSIKAIEISNSNKIWIGTSAGISVFDGFTFTNYTTNEGLVGNSVNDIQKDANGDIWIATNAGISVYNGFTFVNYTTAHGLPTNSIRQVEMDNNNVIWIGTTAGLCRFDNPGFTTFTTANGMPTNSITILEAKDNIYMNAGGPRICIYDGNVFTLYDDSYGLPSVGIVKSISVDIDTNIWIGYSDKLLKFDTINVDYYASNNTNLPSSGIENVYTKTNNIFIASNGGYYYSNNNISVTNDHDTLMINNINAIVNSNGILFANYPSGVSGFFEVPAGSGKHSNFMTNIWLGGIDQNNILHTAGSWYLSDWETGPVSSNYNTYEYDSAYNRTWKINKSDIDYHILHWNDSGYIVPPSILEWPDIAEYLDSNLNGVYDPDSGDYPLIMGDQAILTIYNDDVFVTNSVRNKMKVEIHALVYGYNVPSDSALFNTIFVQYKIKNKSTFDYSNVYMGIHDDFDIGNWNDDYVGVDTSTNSFYAYNGDNFDTEYGNHIPAQGVAFLSSKMTSSTYLNNAFGVTGDPSSPTEYYNILTGYWKDGSPYTYGGNGYGGTTPVDYVFTGNPESPTEWNEAFVGNPPGDRRGVGIIGPFTLSAGQEICNDVAFVNAIAYDGDNILSVKYLHTRMAEIQLWKSQNQGLSCDSIITIPNNTLSIFAQDEEYCEDNGDISLICVQLDGVYPFTYQWADNVGTVFSTDANPVLPLPAVTTTNYYVTITDALGATATDTLTVTLHSSPTLNLGTYSNLCSGDTVVIDISGYNSYEWSNGNNTPIVYLTLPGDYYVTVTGQYGCTAEDNTTLSFTQNTLNINDITPSCVGDIAIIDAGTGFDSYLWNNGDTTQFLLVSTPMVGQSTYYVTVTTSNGCEFTDSTIVDVVAPNTYLGNDTSIFSNETLTLYPGNYQDYFWCDSTTGPQFVFDGIVGPGVYTVWVQTTDYYGCVSTDSIQITVTLYIGINDINKNDIKIYPNPTNGKITIQAEGMESVELNNLQGQIISQKSEVRRPKYMLDLSTQPKGIYIIKVQTERGVAVVKVILE